MKLYDNDSHRDTFTELVYSTLSDDPTWDRANQIIDSFDSAPSVEVPDATLSGTYVNAEWLRRTEEELKKYKELAVHPYGGPGDGSIEVVKPAEDDPHTYLKPCRICGNTEIVYERYKHKAGERWRCWCTKCLVCIDPGWAQDQLAVRAIWNQSPPNEPLTLDQLKGMKGEPVWTQRDLFPEECRWRVIENVYDTKISFTDGSWLFFSDYDKSWLPYRQKPEGVPES